jgi:hypothetical protein
LRGRLLGILRSKDSKIQRKIKHGVNGENAENAENGENGAGKVCSVKLYEKAVLKNMVSKRT